MASPEGTVRTPNLPATHHHRRDVHVIGKFTGKGRVDTDELPARRH